MRTIVTIASMAVMTSGLMVGQSMSDQQFVDNAAQVNMTEAHLGQMAQQKGASADVRQYGQKLQRDHQAAYQRLTSVVTGMSVPKAVDAEHQKIIERFQNLSGKEFDRQFQQTMIDRHQKAIDMFQQAASQVSSQNLRGFATEQLAGLRTHLAEAKSLDGSEHSQLRQDASAPDDEAHRSRAAIRATDGAKTAARDSMRSDVHYGTVTAYTAGKAIELKVRNRTGKHVYDISDTHLSASVPADLAVGSRVVITETVDSNGRRSIKIENEMSSGSTNSKP